LLFYNARSMIWSPLLLPASFLKHGGCPKKLLEVVT
jgi:hypothetical protein